MIYFIQATSDNRIKIGMSDNPTIRLRQLQTGSSSQKPYTILTVLPGGRRREKELHKKFKEYHSHREWFNPASEILEFIAQETHQEIKVCRVCGAFHLSRPEESDIREHSKMHKSIRMGGYPYNIREFMKEMAWAILYSDEPTVKISSRRNKDDIKRVIVYAWWAREKEAGLQDSDFEDYILDYMDYLDVRFSGDKEKLKIIDRKLEKNWGKV
jgi:hypothetical protein